jgi:hypothetical protein
MAIDRIPGVGPQNTDIATAVAAAVPTIAAITSSITTNAASAGLTNASITSAGNAAGWGATGPTTTQIAAAVPTLAQITSSITTNAASAGVTMAAITSTVQANAGSPFGGTYTNIYNAIVANGTTTVTVSGLSSYKYLKFQLYANVNASSDLFITFNSDTANHSTSYIEYRNNPTTPIGVQIFASPNTFEPYIRPIVGVLNSANQLLVMNVEIPNNNAVIPYKDVKVRTNYFDNNNSRRVIADVDGAYHSTSAISSLTLLRFNGLISSGTTTLKVWGAN